jgi:2-iminoacetate synthase
MPHFELNPTLLETKRNAAIRLAGEGVGPSVLEALRSGSDGSDSGRESLDDESLAALFLSEDVTTDELLKVAGDLRAGSDESGCSGTGPQIETFSPLYITNHCDAECVMCGMRSANKDLDRSTADAGTIEEQLDILHSRGLRGVAILTGEYRHGPMRREMLARTSEATRAALERGFTHVLINVGSIEDDEYEDLLSGIPRTDDGKISPHVTMCTFQEAYEPDVYTKFMGKTPENPRSDYARRIANFDRAADAGMRSANPGLLLGLNRDLVFELLALLAHVRHLQERGLQIYISLPRLRKASGAEHLAGVSDDELARIVAVLSAGVPEARVVISTRERPEVQHRLLPVIGVLTAGSPGVAPYSEADAAFEIDASQFEVADQRPLEVILGECLDAGAVIDGYVPSGAYSSPGPSAVSNQSSSTPAQ